MPESMHYDVVIVGAGPAGLSAAIRYAQLCMKANKHPSICVLEKGEQVGAHILSGAVFEPRALDELLPNWQLLNAPIETKVTTDEFLLLSPSTAFRLPTPPQMRNEGNYIISLERLCIWLSEIAIPLGVEIYPGFAANELLFDQASQVIGIRTGDMGRDKFGQPKPTFQEGMNIYAKQTILAEGCRGSLSEQIIKRFSLHSKKSPQTYAIGLKEIWEINAPQHQLGKVTHTIGWPLDPNTYGGSFLYHWEGNLLSIGFVVGLDYQNPYLNPYEEFSRFKHHPKIKPLLANAKCISYGARALNEGGWQSIPKLTFPGGMLIGCAAGFLNVPKIKGSHTAMKSGMLAAETVFDELQTSTNAAEFLGYQQKIQQSWIATELYAARNIRPAFRFGLLPGLLYSAIDTYLLRGKAPWTFSNHSDAVCLKPANKSKQIIYSKPDGVISFDKMTSVSRTNVHHEENQPCHLVLKDPQIAIQINWQEYAGPEARYCPAGVYEFLDNGNGTKKLQINAQNCIHCKTCDIKDPTQNIVWTTPEGGGGPNYSNM